MYISWKIITCFSLGHVTNERSFTYRISMYIFIPGGNGGGGKGLGIKSDSNEEEEGSSGIIDSWNEWNQWSECSKSCGDGGMKVRYRTCKHGNNDIATVCQGQSVQIKPCHVQSC